jgi:hypothetical protein
MTASFFFHDGTFRLSWWHNNSVNKRERTAFSCAIQVAPLKHQVYLCPDFTELALFVGLTSWGFLVRRHAASHKRLMILGTMAILGPAIAGLARKRNRPRADAENHGLGTDSGLRSRGPARLSCRPAALPISRIHAY